MSSHSGEIVAREVILKTEFVDPDYFLVRVRQFEQQYNESWGKFFGEYTSGQADKYNPDFVEWAFLCRNFLGELIRAEEGEGPPGSVSSILPEKPETDSGFCFWARCSSMGRECSTQKNISRWWRIACDLLKMRRSIRPAQQLRQAGISGK